MRPYYADDAVTLYHGDCREILPQVEEEIDCIVTDPPYGETSLVWDHWPDGWPSLLPGNSLWCFGSMRMFLDRRDEFAGWKLSQDVVWEKPMGTGFAADRFKRVHENVLHWYRGEWAEVYKEPQREDGGTRVKGTVHRSANRTPHSGSVGYVAWEDDGRRLVKSVLRAPNMRFRAIHPTEKPLAILDPLVRYACPVGGLVLDPFAGSGSTLEAARATGRRAAGIEAREDYCEAIARRLAQGDLFGGVA